MKYIKSFIIYITFIILYYIIITIIKLLYKIILEKNNFTKIGLLYFNKLYAHLYNYTLEKLIKIDLSI